MIHFFKTCLALALLYHGLALAADPKRENAWSRVRTPFVAQPEAIGGYTYGCQLGAQVLEEQGDGFVSVRRGRNRFYAQPVTLALIRAVGHQLSTLYRRRILIGDLSLPVGGRMPFGHASHQNGLDVDIWFLTVPEGQMPAPDVNFLTVVDRGRGAILSERWLRAYRDALFAAANFPETERIFVNPVIKRHLCDTEMNTAWLHKLRPWFGHDEHFHVRMRCPWNSPQCESQNPIPPGDGCDSGLTQWVEDQRMATLFPKPPKPNNKPKKPKLPPQMCLDLIQR